MHLVSRIAVLTTGLVAMTVVPLRTAGGPLSAPPPSAAIRPGEPAEADTTIVVDKVQVTAIKQGLALRSQPVAATVVGSRDVARSNIDALKSLSALVPNFHAPDYGSRMTSSLYVRGLGARIDQPVMGLNIDNVPLLNKNNYDSELVDIERIEVLRGPQSTLYGRNTMGGVINVYSLSPFTYEGLRLLAGAGNGGTFRARASCYRLLNERTGLSLSGFYTRQAGFYTNLHTGARCEDEQSGGGRLRMQWRSGEGVRVDNTFAFSRLTQGGYPYAYIGEPLDWPEGSGNAAEPAIRPGEIRYNDPASYLRTTISDGLTVRYDAARFSLASISSYSYSDDAMTLDQDFTPLSYFTLTQALREHAVTEEVVIRSHQRERGYGWLFGAYGFWRQGRMEAPVNFKRDGIDRLIFANANASGGSIVYSKASDALLLESFFTMPVWGAALYHESTYTTGRWTFSAGIRFDYERTRLRYRSRTEMDYFVTISGGEPIAGHIVIDDANAIAHSYPELLPSFSAVYAFNPQNNLYLSVSKGYKAGGFNTQMFSDILQEKLKWKMASGLDYAEPDLMSYRPEYSWNYELGGHFAWLDGRVLGDFALFRIDCRDQQLTVFPEGQTTGRMMTNAGRTRSAGAELSLRLLPHRQVEIQAAYGYTHAVFRRYNDGNHDYRGKRIPYVPEQTLSGSVTWTLPTGTAWLGDLLLRAGVRGAGRIQWDDTNSRSQPFYLLADASVRLEHGSYSLDVWGRNVTGTKYDVFYFKSMGNEFVQRGRPCAFGVTLTLHIDHKTAKNKHL